MANQFTNAQDILAFVLAGNATITLQSERTGAHYTYRVRQAKADPTSNRAQPYFVSLLTAPEEYTYIGVLDANTHAFRTTAKSRLDYTSAPVRAWQYMWCRALAGEMAKELVVRHEGRCGKCNRPLTVPSSIDRGIGPECAGRLACMAA